MALDLSGALCAVINADLDQICIPLPGGGEICYHGQVGNIPVPSDICADLIPNIEVSLAMLAPLMCLIDVALAVLEVVKAIPDTVGPPPDPTAMALALADLIEKAMCLLPLIPQLSICPLIKALLDIIINCLIDVRDQLTNIISLNSGVAAGRARSAALGGVALLDAALDCSEENIGLLEAALSGSTESLQRMIDITVNPLLELAGLDPIEVDMSLSAGAPTEVIEALDVIIETLFAIRDALPC
jgi:hypothetical protein